MKTLLAALALTLLATTAHAQIRPAPMPIPPPPAPLPQIPIVAPTFCTSVCDAHGSCSVVCTGGGR